MNRNRTFIYFVKPVGADGPVKIGCSEYPEGRLSSLMTWSPVPLEIVVTFPGGPDLERNIHECFFDQHSHKEWFRPSARLTAAIEALKNGVAVSEAIDLSARLGKMRIGSRGRVTSAERRKFLSYNTRLWQAAKRLGKEADTDCYFSKPRDAFLIMDRWSGWGSGAKRGLAIEPTAQELARLDEVLANPSAHYTRHERTRRAAA